MLWILDIMIIKNIKLVNYRNYNSLNLDFNDKINITGVEIQEEVYEKIIDFTIAGTLCICV